MHHVFHSDPADEDCRECKVEQPLIGDGENHKRRRTGKEDNQEPMDIMGGRLQTICQGHEERSGCEMVSNINHHPALHSLRTYQVPPSPKPGCRGVGLALLARKGHWSA